MTGYLSAADLGVKVTRSDESSLFQWLVASLLFGKRIKQAIAAATWRALVQTHGRDTPRKIVHCTHRELVKILGEGGYARYDESTATRLHLLCRTLLDEYEGGVTGMVHASENRTDFERRLLQLKGVGPVTLRIFMREAAPALYPS